MATNHVLLQDEQYSQTLVYKLHVAIYMESQHRHPKSYMTRDHIYTILQGGIHSLIHIRQGDIHTLHGKGTYIPYMGLARGHSHTLYYVARRHTPLILCGKGAYTHLIVCGKVAYTPYSMLQGGIHPL